MTEFMQVACANGHTVGRAPTVRLADGPSCWRGGNRLFAGALIELPGRTFSADRRPRGSSHGGGFLGTMVWAMPHSGTRAPAYARAAARLEPRMRLAKLNTEAEPRLATYFGMRSIPAPLMLLSGEDVARQSERWVLGTLCAGCSAARRETTNDAVVANQPIVGRGRRSCLP